MPKLASESGRVFVAAHVDREINDRLNEVSSKFGMSKASLIRFALHYALEQPIALWPESTSQEPAPEN